MKLTCIFSFSGGRKVEPRTEPPHFVDILKPLKIRHGDKAVLEGRLTGTPTPRVIWYHGDKEIPPSADFLQEHDTSSGIVKLTIQEIFIDDRGLYRAIAVNEHGRDETTAYVTVEDIELLEKSELRQAPRVILPLEAQVVLVGSSINLLARYDAFPPPIIKWYRDGTEIKRSSDFVIQQSNGETSLQINEVFEDDSGIYEIRIFNEAGEARTSASINILSK